LKEKYGKKTALHFAATNGCVKTVTFLLDAGADPHPLCCDMRTPMHYAAENGHADVIVVLLNNGANPDMKNYTSQTPAHLTAVFDHPQCFQIFVEYYGVKAKQNLHETARTVQSSAPGLILEICNRIANFAVPPADLNIKDDWNKSPMDWAVETMYYGCDLGWGAVDIVWYENILDGWFF